MVNSNVVTLAPRGVRRVASGKHPSRRRTQPIHQHADEAQCRRPQAVDGDRWSPTQSRQPSPLTRHSNRSDLSCINIPLWAIDLSYPLSRLRPPPFFTVLPIMLPRLAGHDGEHGEERRPSLPSIRDLFGGPSSFA
jgi:hypothetical protein